MTLAASVGNTSANQMKRFAAAMQSGGIAPVGADVPARCDPAFRVVEIAAIVSASQLVPFVSKGILRCPVVDGLKTK